MPYRYIEDGDMCSCIDLLSDGIKLLPEKMLTYYLQWNPSEGNFISYLRHQSLKSSWELRIYGSLFNTCGFFRHLDNTKERLLQLLAGFQVSNLSLIRHWWNVWFPFKRHLQRAKLNLFVRWFRTILRKMISLLRWVYFTKWPKDHAYVFCRPWENLRRTVNLQHPTKPTNRSAKHLVVTALGSTLPQPWLTFLVLHFLYIVPRLDAILCVCCTQWRSIFFNKMSQVTKLDDYGCSIITGLWLRICLTGALF